MSIIPLERRRPRGRKLSASKAPREPIARPGRRSHIVAAAGRHAGRARLAGPIPVASGERRCDCHGLRRARRWLMAFGIDLGFVALEIAMLIAPAAARLAVARYASPAIIGTLVTSAAMNAFAFASHAQGLMIYPAIGLGFAVPALVYALTKTGATIYLER